MLTLAATARRLGVSRDLIRSMAAAGQLPTVVWTTPSGRRVVRVPEAKLNAWIEQHYQPAIGGR